MQRPRVTVSRVRGSLNAAPAVQVVAAAAAFLCFKQKQNNSDEVC